MIREVNLVSYLPPFMAEYKEITAALEAENPELTLVWKAADRVLRNEFIETADAYGLSRFEKMLQILPSTEDTLESRRARVQARWFNRIPYTLRILYEKLEALCGASNFTITEDYPHYRIEIQTCLELFGQVEELERIVGGMLPCNMAADLENKILCGAKGAALTAGGVCTLETFTITNDFKERFIVNGDNAVGSGVVMSEVIEIK